MYESGDDRLWAGLREAACCGFLNIDASHTERGVRLIITSENPDALPVIEMLVSGSQKTS